MELEIITVFVLLILTIVAFVLEKISVDVTALAMMGILFAISSLNLSPKWPKLTELLAVFSNEAPLTIACMFIISAALSKCRIIEQASKYLSKFCVYGYSRFMLVLLLLVAVVSAFVNNTPVVVVLLPVVMSLSRDLGVSSSKMLIPLSYASIFGGCCTLVGTSTNILASGIMSTSEIYPQMPPMTMFELTKIGLPLMFVSLAFIIIFGRKLLPEREALTNIISGIERKEFLTEAVILQSSPLIGKKLVETSIPSLTGFRLLDVVRNGKSTAHAQENLVLQAKDKLVLSCKPHGIIEAREIEGMDLFNDSKLGIEQVSSETGIMVEAVVGPSSSLISKSLSDAHFRSRYNLTILAIHRKGKNVITELNDIRLKASDTLLILGSESSIERLRSSEEVILLDNPPLPAKDMKSKAPIVLGVLVCVIGSAFFELLPISIASLLGVSVLLLTNCIRPTEAYKSIEWNILVLIFGMLAMGITMQKTGASGLIASLVGNLSTEVIPQSWQIIVVLIALYLITSCMTELLSNAATIVIMAPISLEIAHEMSMSVENARAYVLTACIAASASFVTPIGYQTNTFVYTVGGYRFGDFIKIGIFLNMIYCLGTIGLVGWLWKFFP